MSIYTPYSIEKILTQLFSYLPPMKNEVGTEFQPKFMYGDQKQLLDFLRQTKNQGSNYPLIWLVYPFEETQENDKVSFDNLTLILAVETNSVMLNNQRMLETYEKVLMPLFGNIKQLLAMSANSSSPQEYRVTKYPNYSSDAGATENAVTYVWDALKISFGGWLKGGDGQCVKPVYFKE